VVVVWHDHTGVIPTAPPHIVPVDSYYARFNESGSVALDVSNNLDGNDDLQLHGIK
jgi:hypothetical protein